MSLSASQIAAAVDDLAPVLRDVSAKIHATPELRFEEHRAAAWIGEAVERSGVQVERGLGGLPTAFRARVGRSGGPRVALLAEYDALPEIGHACGHNLIAAAALGAFLAIARGAGDLSGAVELIGTPAEEGGGGKVKLLGAGVFEGLDAAIMFHPFDRDLLAHRTLANIWVDLRFRGRPSHAAIAPFDGASALTACLDTFRLVDGQRVHFRDGVRVHGFVTNGGQAVNIIPEEAAAQFSVRARDLGELERVKAIVERCARGAAMASGVEVTIRAREGYQHMVNNMTLARRFGAHLSALGRVASEGDDSIGAGSTDMGDVSHAVPSIHPWLAICAPGETTCHQHGFQVAAGDERGASAMLTAAKAMALTALDVISDASLRTSARAEFDARS